MLFGRNDMGRDKGFQRLTLVFDAFDLKADGGQGRGAIRA
jgi:hypothetical protein